MAAALAVQGWTGARREGRASSASPSVLEAEPNEIWRSMGGLSWMQSRPSLVWLASWKSVRGNVCVRRPACAARRAPVQRRAARSDTAAAPTAGLLGLG
jgi:hypothetical protein